MSSSRHHNALSVGHEVNWYRIVDVLGQGSFGITYLARDQNLDTDVALKEYFPSAWAVRTVEGAVAPAGPTHEQDFNWGLDRFISEGRILVRFDHPSLVRVMSVFELNQTAYIVMRFERGVALHEVLAHADQLAEADLKVLIKPLLDGLRVMHAAGVIHRDIKPDNIFIKSDGSPLLLDFGAARKAMGSSVRELTSIGTAGYAPVEQYSDEEGRQGPWTDIYAIGATIYHALVGSAPKDALARANALLDGSTDPLTPLKGRARGEFSAAFLATIEHAMAIRAEDRPRSVQAFAKELGISLEPAVADEGTPDDESARRFKPAIVEPSMVDTGKWEIDGLRRDADAAVPSSGSLGAVPADKPVQVGDLAAAWGAAAGDANGTYYVTRFAAPGNHLGASWNWAAALFTSAWLAYRKMYLWAFFIYPIVALASLFGAWWIGGSVFPQLPLAQGLLIVGWFVGWVLLAGMYGNALYKRKVQAWIDTTVELDLNDVERRQWLRRKGGTSALASILYVIVMVLALGQIGWILSPLLHAPLATGG